MTADPIVIDIVSDVVCPWCFLGKRRLEKAMAMLPEQRFSIHWRPFQLDSTIPREGMPRKTYLERKFGAARLATLHDPLIAAGKAEGIPFAFDKITRSPNTLNAHRLIRWAGEAGKQDELGHGGSRGKIAMRNCQRFWQRHGIDAERMGQCEHDLCQLLPT